MQLKTRILVSIRVFLFLENVREWSARIAMDEQSRMLETQQDADQDNAFGMFGPFPITGKPSQQQQDMFSGGPPHKVNG